MITINSTQIPTPSEFKVGVMDITKSERNANGRMIIELIATKRKLEFSWKYIEKSELSSLLALIGSNILFSVTYPDPLTGTNRTGTFYCGDRNIGAIDYLNGSMRWKDIKFNFVEQ